MALLQDSFDKGKWTEDPELEGQRMRISALDPPEHKRKLFPLSLRIKQVAKVYPGITAGMVIKYARTKMTPAPYPLEGLVFDRNHTRIWMAFTPQEAEIIAPFEDA